MQQHPVPGTRLLCPRVENPCHFNRTMMMYLNMSRPKPVILVILLTASVASAAPTTAPATQPNGGWTVIFPGNRQIHVAANGSDAGDGSLDRPFKTIGRAVAVVRNGDDLLLRRGDTFYDTFGNHKWSH